MIIIDRPKLANQLSTKLSKFDSVKIVGQYTNPYIGLKHVKSTRIDVVFLNIKMSLFNGLTIAKQLKAENPNINIVFVTQDHQYAVKAFEINALDYLIKPIQHSRLQKTLSRIHPQVDEKQKANGMVICCFSSLHIIDKGKNCLVNLRWRTRKTEELFAYLLLNHGKNIGKEFLVDLLWPHISWQRGISQLYNAVYQIRKTLTERNINMEIENTDQYYILHLNDTELDIDQWERAIDHLPSINERTISKHIQLIYQYKGDVFRDSNYIWSIKEKNRLRETWFYHISQVTNYLFEAGKYIQIINIYHHVQQVHPLDPKSYEMLMKLYAFMNNHKAVTFQYKELKKMLDREFDAKPDHKIRSWYSRWCNDESVYHESIDPHPLNS